MEFLKKHYEKIMLALVSVLLMGTALMLMGTFEPKGDGGPARDDTNISRAQPLDTNELKAIAALLKEPPPWAGTNEKPFSIEMWEWDGLDLHKAGKRMAVITNVIEELDWTVTLRTFPMIFKSLASRVGTNDIFQINIGLGGAGTRFVKIGDSFLQPIYGVNEQFTVRGYEEKKVKQKNPRTGGEETVDVSVLTLERRSGSEVKNIPLTVGRTQYEREPVATYYSTMTGERSPPGDLKRGSRFAYKGEQFEILDITEREVLIKALKDGRIERRRPSKVIRQ
ncbi:MAG: hypothetical protein N2689_14685 [Verrucomicrobiae bacterium]|nr:hypothetical protein [Verrucomicrobiae bacterium]